MSVTPPTEQWMWDDVNMFISRLPDMAERTRYVHRNNILQLLRAGITKPELLSTKMDDLIKILYDREVICGKSRKYSIRNSIRLYREAFKDMYVIYETEEEYRVRCNY